MIRYVFKSAKKSSLFVTSTLLLTMLLSSVPASLSSLESTKASTEQSIAQYSRGSYDILVRKESSTTPFEKQSGLVEENFLSGGQGGISLEEYEKIKKIQDIDVAAPVSVLGYFSNGTGSVILPLPKMGSNPLVSSISISNHTGLPNQFNEVNNTYAVQCPIPDAQMPLFVSVSCDANIENGHIELALTLPPNYFPIVGVDGKEEAKLVGKGTDTFLNLQPGISYKNIGKDKKLPVVPLLVNEDQTTYLQATVETRNSYQPAEPLYKSLLALPSTAMIPDILKSELGTIPIETKTYQIGPLKPFEDSTFTLTEDGKSTKGSDTKFTSGGSMSSYYLADKLEYKQAGDGFVYDLIPDTSSTSDPTYRKLEKKGKEHARSQSELLFMPEIVGNFHANEFTSGRFDASPLGLYSFSPVMQMAVGSGKTSPEELKKDFSPNTFLPMQVSALTNLESAASLKGERPIDAIRVRVAGIDSYNSDGEAKILKVANLIQQATGLHADIVAGASKQIVQVNVPAVGKTPAIGAVQEVWTSLGVAIKIEKAVNQLSVLTTAGLVLLVIIYASVHVKTLLIVRQKELHLLMAIGWTKKEIRKLLVREWQVKISLAVCMALLVAFGLYQYIPTDLYWIYTLSVQAFILLVLWVVVSISIRNLGKSGALLGSERESKRSRITPQTIGSLVSSNFLSHISYNLLKLLLFTFSNAVALFTINIVLAARKNIDTTFLGNVVNTNNNSLLWFVVISALSIILFGVWEATRALVVKREREIKVLKMIGWKESEMNRLLLGELAIVLGLGSLLGLLLAFGAFTMFYQHAVISLLVQTAACIGVFVLLLAIASRSIGHFAKYIK